MGHIVHGTKSKSVGKSIFVSSTHLEPKTRFLSPSDSWCGAPSLTRWRVCCLQLMLVLASAVILEPESCGTHDHVLLSQIRDSSNINGHVPVFISPRERVAQLYLQALGSISSPPTTRRTTASTRECKVQRWGVSLYMMSTWRHTSRLKTGYNKTKN
jgi:hypothetical protein